MYGGVGVSLGVGAIWSWSYLLIGVLKKVFEWLAANKGVYVGWNNNEVDSIEIGRIIIADLLP